MHCPSCGSPNPPGARFCGSCAAPLDASPRCPSCGTSNRAGQRFCNGCGEALTASTAPPPEHLAEKIRVGRGALEGERKQVTVLFADAIGSMELAERTGPEEWRRIMERFYALLSDGVHRFEGTVDKFTGDGIMALFGAPVAHEDHARRACHAALHLQRELAAFASDLRHEHGLSFSVRMGLNSGEVVVGTIGEDLGMAYTAVGHTVGLAQRMEQLAEPGAAYLSEHTASLVEGYLALADLGRFRVKGARRPLRVHELVGAGGARGWLDAASARGFSRFVGRDEELQILERALERAYAGEGRVVGIVGEAGVGKSRLCHELTERRKGIRVHHLTGQAHTRSIPFAPVLELLRSYFEIREQDTDATARERIAGPLLAMDDGFADDLPLLFDFLAVPDPERPPPRMDPEARRRRLLGLLKRLTRARSAREPGIFVFEDLHWLDPASEAFLANLVEAVQGTRSLVVLNFRPEYHAAWMSRSHYRQIALAPLGAAAVDALLADLLGADPSLDGLVELVRGRTGGNPFFVEELVRALVEAGTLEGTRGAYRLVRSVEEATVPASVQAVLAARIDRLAPREKAVLQAAAVIGKEFSEPVLRRVVELEPGALEDALRALVVSDFVQEQEVYPEARYAFRHPLTQEVAYGSQLAGRRVGVHAAVARAMTAQYPERLDERAAALAEHWEAAGDTLQAARWHARAATWAGTTDPRPALRHWRKVGELVDALPESKDAVALGLAARISLLEFGWRLGISHTEAAAVFEEAERLASSTGDVRSLAILLSIYGLIRGVNEGDLRRCTELARQAVALAERSGDPALYLAVAPTAYGFLATGDHQEGIAICDRAIELAAGDATVGAGTLVACPFAMAHVFKGAFLLDLGELDEAGRLFERGRELAREQADIEGVGLSHSLSTRLAYFRGDPEAALGHARQAVEIAERIGSSQSRARAWLSLGSAERMRGHWRPAVEALERSRAIAKERGIAVDVDGWRLALLAESHLGLGDAEQARRLAEEGLAIGRAQGNVFGETYASVALARILLASAGPHGEIEAALSRALELTRRTGAKAYEPLIHAELATLARRGTAAQT